MSSQLFVTFMKSLLKFALLAAIIISGKFAKHPEPAIIVQNTKLVNQPNTSVVYVHQVLTSAPVKSTRGQAQPEQSGSGLLAEMF